jgi:hypothetical protein
VGTAKFESTLIDNMVLSGDLSFDVSDEGLSIKTDKKGFKVKFDESRYRPFEVPLLLSISNK